MVKQTSSPASKPRVLHVVAALQRGGLEGVLIQLVRGLEQRGWQQAVCLQQGRGEGCEEIPRTVPIYHLSAPPNSWTTVRRLTQLTRDFDAEIIHSLAFAVWGEAAAVRLRSPRVRHVHAFHGFFGPMPRRWQWYGRCFARGTDACYAVAPNTALEAARHFGINHGDIMVLKNGVDLERFAPPPAAKPSCDRPMVCVTVGSVKDVKRPDRVVEIARRTESHVRFVWVGDGPLLGTMVQHVRELGMQERIQFVGPDPNVARWLQDADIFLLTSEHEAAPLCVLEAMAAGLPIVAPPVGEVESWLTRSSGGILVHSGAEVEFSAAIERLSKNPQQRSLMGQAGREYVMAEHSLRRMLNQYERFFESCVAGEAGMAYQRQVALRRWPRDVGDGSELGAMPSQAKLFKEAQVASLHPNFNP